MRRVRTIVLLMAVVLFAASSVLAAGEAAQGGAQKTCPVMALPINKSVYADYQGKRVYFCCEDCRKEFNKDPASYIKKMEDQGVTLEKTPGAQ